MIIKYMVKTWLNSIERVEILRETEKSVFFPRTTFENKDIGERRESKSSGYGKYYDTWNEAHGHLLDNAKVKEGAAENNLETAIKNRRLIEKMFEAS